MAREKFVNFCENNKGFTILEVLTVLVIMGILAVIAIPAFRGIAQGSQVSSAVNDLVSSFNYARNEAITRGTLVTVCKSHDAQTCDTGAVGWQQGWIVYHLDDAGAMQILRVYGRSEGPVVMEGNFHVRNRLRYMASGFMPGVSNGTIAATVGDRQINIVISNTGRVRTQKM
ncbi:MAG: GspH/FimT family pseudopilin [Desulfuromonadales bacterium]|nr:GspH/FimT family pseudopilin [Desulfuromonadales bacterium]